MKWSDEQKEQLRELYVDGRNLSGSQIATRMRVTRNAVIGQLNRMIRDSEVVRRGGVVVPKGPKPPPKPRRRVYISTVEAPSDTKLAVEEPPDMTLAMSPCSLTELTSTTCRWPVGDPTDPGFYFCGGLASEGQPYCPHHRLTGTKA